MTLRALIPALLYHAAVFAAIPFESRRIGLSGLPREELPRLSDVLREHGHLALPLFVIVGMLFAGWSAPFAALAGIASVLPTAALRASSRQHLTVGNIAEALVAGARDTVSVALACGCAGIVIGVITLTGLGLAFTSLVLSVAKDTLVVALVLTMCAGIVLGTGMQTSPAYIVQVALLVPALVELGVVQEAAHLFALCFAVLSAITPPVALAVYAANGLSGANLWDTGVAAVELGLTGYIVPFMFVFGPALLLEGSWPQILLATVTAFVGVVCLSSALAGYARGPLAVWQRLALAAAALVLSEPGPLSDALGAGLVILALAPEFVRSRRLA